MKEIDHKRRSQDKSKTENSFYFLFGCYLHFKIISEGLLRHGEIPRDINELKMPT